MCSNNGNKSIQMENGLMCIVAEEHESAQVTCYGCLESFPWTRECSACGSFFCGNCINEHACAEVEA